MFFGGVMDEVIIISTMCFERRRKVVGFFGIVGVLWLEEEREVD